jgi:hypothetical protein
MGFGYFTGKATSSPVTGKLSLLQKFMLVATISTDFHFVADAGEQVEFLHVFGAEKQTGAGFFSVTVPAA